MTNPDNSHLGRVAKPMSRRKAKKAAKQLERAQSSKVQAEKDAAIRSSRARCLHRILARPGRGGLSAKGAAQLQQFFSKKVPESKKPKLREMDASVSAVLLQMATEETDAEGLSYGELERFAEETLMADGSKDEKEKGDEEDGKGEEDMRIEDVMVVEEEEVGEENEEQGGVALAQDL